MIHGEYADIPKVVGWIACDLERRFPGAEAVAFLDTCGSPTVQAHRGPLSSLLSALSEYCRSFPGAWVCYEPEHPYGRAVKIVGHCGRRSEECEKKCANHLERRVAMLVITRAGQTEVRLGRILPP